MKNAVMKPQAMNAAMFGMIIPDRNVPNFCTAILVPLDFLAGVSACAVTCVPFRRGPAGSSPSGVRVRPLSVTQRGPSRDTDHPRPAAEIRKEYGTERMTDVQPDLDRTLSRRFAAP